MKAHVQAIPAAITRTTGFSPKASASPPTTGTNAAVVAVVDVNSVNSSSMMITAKVITHSGAPPSTDKESPNALASPAPVICEANAGSPPISGSTSQWTCSATLQVMTMAPSHSFSGTSKQANAAIRAIAVSSIQNPSGEKVGITTQDSAVATKMMNTARSPTSSV